MSARYRQQLEATESDEWQQDLPRYSEAGSDSETLEEAIDDTLMAQVIPERRRYARMQLNNFSSPRFGSSLMVCPFLNPVTPFTVIFQYYTYSDILLIPKYSENTRLDC